MMCEDAPVCVCGAKDWSPGGGSFGGLSQQWMNCKSCGRPMCILFGYSNGCVFQHRDVGGDINDFASWLNDVMLVVLRAEGEHIDEARSAFLEESGREFRRQNGVPLDATPDDIRKDKELDEKYTQWWYSEAASQSPEYRRPTKYALNYTPPIPPNIPEKMHLRLLCWGVNGERDNSDYVLVETIQSLSVAMPPDPIRVHHDEFYLPVLAELGIADFKLIDNQYCGAKSEPWYEFNIGETVFTVGPRKRVTSISVRAPSGINTVKIGALAQSDSVTYEADNRLNDFDKAETSNVLIHAWGKDKLKEYLAILIEEAKQGVEQRRVGFQEKVAVALAEVLRPTNAVAAYMALLCQQGG